MDILGTISGIVGGVAFAPWNSKAQAQYLVTGAVKGVGGTIATVNAGFGGSVGYALQKEKGLVKGVKGGIGAIPQMVGEELKKGTTIALAGLTLIELLPYIIIGVVVLIMLSRK